MSQASSFSSQKSIAILEPNTFSFDAIFSSVPTTSGINIIRKHLFQTSGINSSLETNNNLRSVKSNLILVGGNKLGIRFSSQGVSDERILGVNTAKKKVNKLSQKIYWQIGNI